jgi:hypothetical protein
VDPVAREALIEETSGVEASSTGAAFRRYPSSLDSRDLTITTAIALAAHEAMAGLPVGDEIELLSQSLPRDANRKENGCQL